MSAKKTVTKIAPEPAPVPPRTVYDLTLAHKGRTWHQHRRAHTEADATQYVVEQNPGAVVTLCEIRRVLAEGEE